MFGLPKLNFTMRKIVFLTIKLISANQKHFCSIDNKSTSTYVFGFNLSVKIYSSVEIHHGNRAYFVQQIVWYYDQ